MRTPVQCGRDYTAIHHAHYGAKATAILLPELIGKAPDSRLLRATRAAFNAMADAPLCYRQADEDRAMKIKVRPAVFTADKITLDMLMLVAQALAVGAAAAMLSAAMVAGFIALLG